MEEMDPATFTPPDSPLTVADVMASPQYRDLFTPMLSEGDLPSTSSSRASIPMTSWSACRTSLVTSRLR